MYEQYKEKNYVGQPGPEYSNSVIGSGYDDPKIRNREVPAAFDRLEKTIRVFSESINELNNRLSPVSHPEGVSTNQVSAKAPQPMVPMVNAIQMATEMLEMQHATLRSMIERLAV